MLFPSRHTHTRTHTHIQEAKSDVERRIAENKKGGGLLEWDDEASDQRMALDEGSEADRPRKPRKITADSEAENLSSARVSAEHSQESSASEGH